jgi:hypothetical protein
MLDFARTIWSVLDRYSGKEAPVEEVEASLNLALAPHLARRPELRLIGVHVHKALPSQPYSVTFDGVGVDSPMRTEFYSAWLQMLTERSAALAGVAAGYQLKAEALARQGIAAPGVYKNGSAELVVRKHEGHSVIGITVGGTTYGWTFDEHGKREP